VAGSCLIDGVDGAETKFEIVPAFVASANIRNTTASSSVVDSAWATLHLEFITRAVAEALAVSEVLVRVEIIHGAAGPNSMFSMRFILVVEDKGLPPGILPSDHAQIKQWIAGQITGSVATRRLARASQRELTGFTGELIKALETADIPVPDDLYTAEATIPEPAQAIPEYFLALPQWVIGSFASCPTLCGEAEALRTWRARSLQTDGVAGTT